MDRLRTISVHMHCTACRGTGWFAGEVGNPCHCQDEPINIVNEPCGCPAGQCQHFVSDDAHCINRLVGDVQTLVCAACNASTWHRRAGPDFAARHDLLCPEREGKAVSEFTCTCGSNDCWREEVDIGVGTIMGPWHCSECGIMHRDALAEGMEMIEEDGLLDLENQLDAALDLAFPLNGREK
jgi:hypothetical protein